MKASHRKALEEALATMADLDNAEYLELLEYVMQLIKERQPVQGLPGSNSLLDLQGLGKEIWRDVNVEQYINDQRDSWK